MTKTNGSTMRLQHTGDRAAIALSLLCIVHCILLPILVLVLPAVTFLAAVDNELVHGAMLLVAVPISVLAMYSGYHKHKVTSVVGSTLAGILVLISAFFLHEVIGDIAEAGLTVLGSVLLASGHLRNYRLSNMARA